MQRKNWWRLSCASAALATALQPALALAQTAGDVETAPPSSAKVQAMVVNEASEPVLTQAQKLALMRQNIKHVFVLFQENRSFDFYFGTYPGARGLFSKPSGQIAGFTQPIVNTDGTVGTISPFLITQTVAGPNGAKVPLYPADTDSVDHSHAGIDNSLDVVNGTARNDRYALNAEGLTTANGSIVSLRTGQAATSNPTLAQKQKAELTMSHVDCDTVPFLWQYADHFALFDNFRQTTIGPSTPNAIAMIAGQSGETQWALHPGEGSNNTASNTVSISGGEPVVADPGPFPGSNNDFSASKPPYNPGDENPATPGLNQTYATLPLSFMGQKIQQIIQTDENPAMDLLDVQNDIRTIAGNNLPSVPWGWYQEGYDTEPNDPTNQASGNPHNDYIVHHNGPQYFGYIGDNPQESFHLHGLGDFFAAVSNQTLPARGVFYLRGGYGNLRGQKPVDPNPKLATVFPGNDDHPGYSDAQISESLIADEVNAIAASPYWKDSAIIIAYDETDGLYDHAVPRIRSNDPEGNPLAGGPRIPAIVISPFAKVHAVVHAYQEHSSVIKLINNLFGLTPLADLPDEVRGRQQGLSVLGQANLGPADDKVDGIGDMFAAFDNARLSGQAAPLSAEYATIPAAQIQPLPHLNGQGCYALNIVPTDYQNGVLLDPPPADFNPRPNSDPGTPALGTGTP